MATARRIVIAAAVCSSLAGLREAAGQPNLPPPPPPPIGEEGDEAPMPAPPPPPTSVEGSPRRARPSPSPAPSVESRAHARRRAEFAGQAPAAAAPPLAAPAQSIAFTWNPLGLYWGRLSANAELSIARHHSLVASPYALVFETDRGSRGAWISEGFGFASPSSLGVGGELGYHYWQGAAAPLRGFFVGPAVLLGTTSAASVGDPTHVQGYWGGAFDVGDQEVLGSGFTAGVGAGVGFVHMAGQTAIVPRLLLVLGWAI